MCKQPVSHIARTPIISAQWEINYTVVGRFLDFRNYEKYILTLHNVTISHDGSVCLKGVKLFQLLRAILDTPPRPRQLRSYNMDRLVTWNSTPNKINFNHWTKNSVNHLKWNRNSTKNATPTKWNYVYISKEKFSEKLKARTFQTTVVCKAITVKTLNKGQRMKNGK